MKVFVYSIFVLVLQLSSASGSVIRRAAVKVDSLPSWDHLTFTQFWPQAQCYFKQDTNGDGRGVKSAEYVRFNDDHCVPEGVTNWTIHGLWPSEGREHGPGYCNSSWPFNESEIEDLRQAMLIHWPTYEDEDPEQFWQHEWEKHGTCATILRSLNSEHKYFATSLAMNRNIDLKSILAKSNIVPSEEKDYKLEDIQRAISDGYGANVFIQCIQSEEKGQLLSVVEVCMNKEFKPVDCPDVQQECDDGVPIRYLPIERNTRNHQLMKEVLF